MFLAESAVGWAACCPPYNFMFLAKSAKSAKKVWDYMEKNKLLTYYRERISESSGIIEREYGKRDYRKLAEQVNRTIKNTHEQILNTLLQRAKKEKWSNIKTLETVLMLTYTCDVVMLESRNEVWQYDYMSFSRRIGELWEPFCKLCFEYPIKEIELFVPPLFSEVRDDLTSEINSYINKLNITDKQKEDLKNYYKKVWNLVTSGEIKLELDLHFKFITDRFNVDFKSGFGSNEKGNTNRLLMVAAIYKSLEQNYKCILLVRSQENQNNHYFQTLKKSGVWEAYCGNDTYNKIFEYTGFDIKKWITHHIDWENDLSEKTAEYFHRKKLDKYLVW